MSLGLLTHIVLIATVFGIAGCSQNRGFAPPSGTASSPQTTVLPTKVRVGLTFSKSGTLVQESKEQTQGLTLWANMVNGRGGMSVGTRKLPVELVSYDDEGNADLIRELYARLITEERVDFLVSPYGSEPATVSAAVSEEHGATNIVSGAGANSIFSRGYRHAFQVYTPSDKYLVGAVDILKRVDPTARRIAFVYLRDTSGVEIVEAAQDYARQQGFEVVLNEGYPSGTTDFDSALTALNGSQTDAIFGGGRFDDGVALTKQLAQRGVKASLLALRVAPALPDFGQIGSMAAGIIAPSQWEPQVSFSEQTARAAGVPYFGPSVREFFSRYREQFGYDPGYHAAGGYAAGLVLEKAISDAGTLQQPQVEEALARMDVMQFFGRIKFDTNQHFGLQTGHEMVYVQWQKGAYLLERQIVWPDSAASARMQYPKPEWE